MKSFKKEYKEYLVLFLPSILPASHELKCTKGIGISPILQMTSLSEKKSEIDVGPSTSLNFLNCIIILMQTKHYVYLVHLMRLGIILIKYVKEYYILHRYHRVKHFQIQVILNICFYFHFGKLCIKTCGI